jgi:hypothetical protein
MLITHAAQMSWMAAAGRGCSKSAPLVRAALGERQRAEVQRASARFPRASRYISSAPISRTVVDPSCCRCRYTTSAPVRPFPLTRCCNPSAMRGVAG